MALIRALSGSSGGGGGTSLLLDEEIIPTDTSTPIDTGINITSGVFAVMLQGLYYNWSDYVYFEDGQRTVTVVGDSTTQIDVVKGSNGNLQIQLKNGAGAGRNWHLYVFG